MRTLKELQAMSVEDRACHLRLNFYEIISKPSSWDGEERDRWLELSKLLEPKPEPLPDNLDELIKKFHFVLAEGKNDGIGGFLTLAAYVAPHLVNGLNPGDECRGQNEESEWYQNVLYYTGGKRRDGKIILEYIDGRLGSFSGVIPIPKKQRYLISYSQIVAMAEKGEGCSLAGQGYIQVTKGGIFAPDFLIKHAGQLYSGLDVPEIWIEEK